VAPEVGTIVMGFARQAFLSALVLLLPAPDTLRAADEFSGKVIGVHDGDTITVLRDRTPVKIRLFGIDCPETGQDFGSRAKIVTLVISPDAIIPGPYNVTFKRRTTNPVGVTRLIEQIKELRLDDAARIIGLGGKEYRAMIERAFASFPCSLSFPFSGLPIGLAMQATKRAIQTGNPWGDRSHL
jgi:hypothetical protein